jgi:hypothetical protein
MCESQGKLSSGFMVLTNTAMHCRESQSTAKDEDAQSEVSPSSAIKKIQQEGRQLSHSDRPGGGRIHKDK